MAIGTYQALLEHSLRVHDVSIVSFDDSELAQVVRPGLTSIALPHEEMGQLAIELLLEAGLRAGSPHGSDGSRRTRLECTAKRELTRRPTSQVGGSSCSYIV